MAVLFSATPNPVDFTQVEVNNKTQKQVTLAWGTGNPQVKARVYRTLSGQAETLVGDPANTLAATGTIKDTLGYVLPVQYTLRDTAKKQVGTPLTVRTVLVVPPPPPPPPTAPPLAIRRVRMLARGDAIWITFRTDAPSAPWVELVDPATGALVAFWARPDVQVAHTMTLTGIGAPLEQGHTYAFRIVADKDRPVNPTSNPVLTGTVVSGTRRVVVYFQGANASSPDGPLDLYAAAGDVDAGTIAGRLALGTYSANTSEFIDHAIVVDRAGPTVWVWLAADYRIDRWYSVFYADISDQPTVTPQPGEYESDNDDQITGYLTGYYPANPGLGAGPGWSPMVPTEESHQYDLSWDRVLFPFGASISLDTTVTDGRWNFTGYSDEQMRRYQTLDPFSDTIRSTDGGYRNRSAILGTRSARVSPFGDLVVTVRDTARIVAGPVRAVTGVADPDGALRLIGLRADGELVAARCPVDAPPDPAPWRALGLADVRECAVASVHDAMVLVAVRADGEVHHARLTSGPDPRWQLLATGARSATLVDGGESRLPGVIVVDTRGQVRYHELATAQDRSGDGLALGTVAPGGVAASRHADGSVSVLIVADSTSEAHLLGWPDAPSPVHHPNWTSLGPIAAVYAGTVDGPIDDVLGAPALAPPDRT